MAEYYYDRMPSPTALAAAAGVAFVIFQAIRKTFKRSHLDAIPSVGIPSYPFGFYVGAWNYINNGRTVTEEGYLKVAPDDSLSAYEAANTLLQMEYTIGHEQHYDPYHIVVVRNPMTRNIGVCFPDIRNEVVAAFEDLVPATTGEWISVPAMQTILPIVSRVSNRFFIGLKCRDPDYIKITTQFALDVSADAAWLHITPPILRPIAARLFGHLATAIRGVTKHLGPILQHRLEMDDKYGPDWPNADRPKDMISWLLDEARGHPKRRTGFLHAFYNLAANLEYVEPLREEIESVLRTEGWTKAAMGKMVKLDSFLKESSRYVPGGAVGTLREVVKDFTFSDGTTVPAGTLVGVPILAEHHDKANYVNGDMFDPFRFSRMREEMGEGFKYSMVTPSSDFLTFGIGRHACPGRFFAVNEQKLIMSHVIMTYDFKLKDGVRPEDEWVAVIGAANSTAEVMFRRRN
ncbi:cytochrome P450 [Mycena leptocephala]|nr:cytochrome P450 [Mycena leptocephala]